MTKHAIKFLVGAGLMVLIGLGVVYALHFFSPEYRQEQAARDLVRKEKEMKQAIYADTYGGNSPEETLDLFVDAIKKRDIDLAVKYYVVPQQDKARKEFSNLTNEEVNNIVNGIASAKKGNLKIDSDIATFSYTERVTDGYIMVNGRKIPVPDGDSEQTIQLGRNPNRRWKILHL